MESPPRAKPDSHTPPWWSSEERLQYCRGKEEGERQNKKRRHECNISLLHFSSETALKQATNGDKDTRLSTAQRYKAPPLGGNPPTSSPQRRFELRFLSDLDSQKLPLLLLHVRRLVRRLDSHNLTVRDETPTRVASLFSFWMDGEVASKPVLPAAVSVQHSKEKGTFKKKRRSYQLT